jgi:hypothetical protein
VKRSVTPSPTFDDAGVTAIETKVAEVTVRVLGAEVTDPLIAVIWALPASALLANP